MPLPDPTGSQFSLRSVRLRPADEQGRISAATGFFVERAANFYLVTNMHVVTGINQDTGDWLSRAGTFPRLPTCLEIEWPRFEGHTPETRLLPLVAPDGRKLYDGADGFVQGAYPARDVAVVLVPASFRHLVAGRHWGGALASLSWASLGEPLEVLNHRLRALAVTVSEPAARLRAVVATSPTSAALSDSLRH